MAFKNNASVVFDVGTSKILALAGQNTEENKIEILGVSKVNSAGIKRGIIINIEEAAASLIAARNELEKQIDGKIKEADIAFASQHMKIISHQGYRFTSDNGIVSEDDVNELQNEALNVNVEKDHKILQVIPQLYKIDEDIFELNPVGISGKKIEAKYKIITVPEIELLNIERVFEKAGIKIGEIRNAAQALGESVLSDEEKEVGAIVIDIGAGTTKMAAFYEGVLVHSAVIPFGGNVITADIKEGCAIHQKWAEQLKIQYGQALGDFAEEQKYVTIPGINGWESKEISFKSLAFIIQARLEEIIDSVYYQIEKSGVLGKLGSGIVLTGGTSELKNLISLVKFRTGFDTRHSFPVIHPINMVDELKNQQALSALGLLKMALEGNEAPVKQKKKKRKKESRFSPWLKDVVQGVFDYMGDDDDTDMKWHESKN
jgi:cell division protein FtsA